MTSTETIIYRLFEDADLPGVLRLWEHHSGWGAISAEKYLQWNFGGPYGKSLIVIAENESGEVVGQGVLAPSRLWIDGREVKVLRITAPILHDSVRQQNIRRKDHPAVQLISYSFEAAWEQGFELVYALPAIGWVPMLKMLPSFGISNTEVHTYDCFSIPLNMPLPENDKNIMVKKLNGSFGNHYDELWRGAVLGIPVLVGIIRNKAWLKWKLSACNVFEVYQNEQFIGYAAIDKKGLLVDILARRQTELRTVLIAVQNHLCQQPDVLPKVTALNGMLSPMMESVLQSVAFNRENYQFAFGLYPNISGKERELLKAPNWFIMPND